MKISKLIIQNFRGVKSSELLFRQDTVLVGDNNTGKSSILEAIDLVLGPERLSRYPVIDEHDFYAGQYLSSDESPIIIHIEVIITDLSKIQQTHFRNHIEWWNLTTSSLLEGPPIEQTDAGHVIPALRVKFRGSYDREEDDFTGESYFSSPQNEDDTYSRFGRIDKRQCGFLFLRTLRTGSRALSLEKGSLLDVILRLQDLRPQMWEEVLSELRTVAVATDPELGISPILESVQMGIRSFVPSEWAVDPHLRVSDLTRVHLRKLLTVFMGTGALNEDGEEYSAPFQHQGTGTINTLVLTLLIMIAELKQNVIFAMEEPEIAIPPHTQKSIINSVKRKAAQAIFTSHSPYVLEEFRPSDILVVKRVDGVLSGVTADYPPTIKPKKYREEFKRRFCETLLARRVLIAEGRTEFDAFPASARRLHDLQPERYSTLEALGIAVINAETDSQVEPLGKFYKALGKEVFALFDKQSSVVSGQIRAVVHHPFEAPEKGFENVVLNGIAESALRRHALSIVSSGEWPSHWSAKAPTETTPFDDLKDIMSDYLGWAKGMGSAADLLSQCSHDEMPLYIRTTLESIKQIVESPPVTSKANGEQTDLSLEPVAE